MKVTAPHPEVVDALLKQAHELRAMANELERMARGLRPKQHSQRIVNHGARVLELIRERGAMSFQELLHELRPHALNLDERTLRRRVIVQLSYMRRQNPVLDRTLVGGVYKWRLKEGAHGNGETPARLSDRADAVAPIAARSHGSGGTDAEGVREMRE